MKKYASRYWRSATYFNRGSIGSRWGNFFSIIGICLLGIIFIALADEADTLYSGHQFKLVLTIVFSALTLIWSFWSVDYYLSFITMCFVGYRYGTMKPILDNTKSTGYKLRKFKLINFKENVRKFDAVNGLVAAVVFLISFVLIIMSIALIVNSIIKR